jgi:HAD superfamily hydrolase (TIGR01509 family)
MNEFESNLNIFQPQDEEQEIQAILKRRKVAGTPLPKDLQEARQKLVRDTEKRMEQQEQGDIREIQEIFDLAIFDWDGVLCDSMENMAHSAIAVAKHFDKSLSPEEFLQSYDQPYWEYYQRLGIPARTEEEQEYIYNLFHEKIWPIIEKQQKELAVYPEVEGTLSELSLRGVKIAIVSAEQEKKVKGLIEKYNLGHLFDFVITRNHNKTEAIMKLCEEQEIDPDRAVMFGDLPSDIRDAHEAGIKAVAVARPKITDSDERLGAYDPEYLVPDLGPGIFRLIPYEDKINQQE